jgi:hypothetical protein
LVTHLRRRKYPAVWGFVVQVYRFWAMGYLSVIGRGKTCQKGKQHFPVESDKDMSKI